ncbi:MAG: lipoyl(octanoyl) transferase LipB [Deltaproteobacteria bacterium]|nr:lipoyl(octanoyl) transferase LipB [Deltaproteobacteria bacterium]
MANPLQCEVRDLGIITYQDAWDLQEKLRAERLAGEIPDTLLLLEHPPVFTLGRRPCETDLLVPREVLQDAGIEVIQSNRGGRITYHGPGQLVGYFIFSLDSVKKSVQEFVCAVEELCRLTIADFGVVGTRDQEHPGIWIGKNKIAAVGMHFSRGVSQHGFALNVNPNLMHYQYIIPCGIHDRGVASLESLLPESPSMNAVKERLQTHLREVF